MIVDKPGDSEMYLASRRKMVRERFEYTARYLIPWLLELAYSYKSEHGEYLCGYTLLPQYYKDKRDREVAAFAALFGGDGERSHLYVHMLRDLLTEHPWEWFRSRGFIDLGTGANMNKRLCGSYGAAYIDISTMFSHIYLASESYFSIAGPNADIEDFFRYRCNGISSSVMPEISGILKDVKGIGGYDLRWLRVALGDVWGDKGFLSNTECRCPCDKRVSGFMSMLFPEYKRYGTFDDSVSLFGFENDIDFFYAYLAYKDLEARKPDECRRLMTTYTNWYRNGQEFNYSYWLKFVPK